jgi:hypothetical protein
MSEMVERVAKAISAKHGYYWTEHLALARTAIEAMREPTGAMVKAGDQKNHEDALIEAGCINITNELPAIYDAMIDAALAETSRPQSAQLGPGMIPQPPEPSQ